MLELLLFGAIEVRVEGVSLRSLSAKGRLLLAYLALHAGRPMATGAIADALFPDSQAEDPHDLIKKAASEVRRLLGKEGDRLVSPAPRRLTLDLEGAHVDWLAFQSALKRGDLESLQHAVALHTQPLLDRETLYWAIEEQDTCLRLRQQALETLYREAMERGDLDNAGNWLLQTLKFALPAITVRETMWREWMEAMLSKQEYGSIQRHYSRLQTFLTNTIGRPPEMETQALYNRIPKSVLLQLVLAGNKKRGGGLPASARLPHFPFALIGRDTEKKELLTLFKSARLVTVVGIGGVGKTRLAAQVAAEMGADCNEEVGFLDLTPCMTGGVLPALANLLGVKESGSRSLYQSLQEFLAPRHLLLVIDNCEHVIEEVACLVSDVLRDSPNLRCLLTSRQRLQIEEEHIFALPPLALPDSIRSKPPTSDLSLHLADIRESPAIRLFIERAAAVCPGFQLTVDNAPLMVELCRLVEGIPLGLEIAASQAAGVPLERIAAELSQSVLQLKHSRRTVTPRHQTLHATLEWSYRTLSLAEKRLLRRLAVFSGGWTLEAAEQVCADELLPQQEIAAVLSELVTKSLVVLDLSQQAVLPYRFLETIRVYAAELLDEEKRPFQEAHCRYYLHMLTSLNDLSKLKAYLVAVDRNRSNLYIAMQRSLEAPDVMPLGHQIGMALHTYWAHRALSSEAREWHRSFLRAGEDHLPGESLAASMLEIAEFSAGLGQGGSEEAQECRRRAFEIYHARGDRKGESDVYFSLGMRQAYLQQMDEAYLNLKKASEYYRQTDHPYMVAFLLVVMSGCLLDVRYDAECETMYREALEIARSRQMHSLEGLAWMSMGERAQRANRLEQAEAYFTRSVAAYSRVDSPWGTVKSQSQLADVRRLQGDLAGAQALLYGSLVRAAEFSNRRETLTVLALCVKLLHSRQDWEASLSLAAGLLHLSATFPDSLILFQDELQTIVAEASIPLDAKVAEAMLLGARMADFDTLLDYTLTLLQRG